MTILFAIGEQTLSDILRKPLVENDFDVISDEVLHRNYLNEFIGIQRPQMLILHDIYLPSDISDQELRDVEMLELIEEWRMRYDNDLRIIYMCVRDRKDPFLAQLVARNVLDIFYEKNISTESFISQLQTPPKFSNVSRFGTGDIEINFNEPSEEDAANEEDPSEDKVQVDLEKDKPKLPGKLAQHLQDGAKSLKGIAEKRAEAKAEAKANTPEKAIKVKEKSLIEHGVDESVYDEILDIMPVDKPLQPKANIIGTVLIAVAGVTDHLGTTHTAISIASHLKDQGHSVALVESNYSQDFDRIHSLYEGEKLKFIKDKQFEMQGLLHFKYRDELDLNDIYSGYEYVVMDFGDLYDAANVDDFKRAHIKCVLCSADEWKYHWVVDFINTFDVDNSYCFISPGSGSEKLKDLNEQIDYGTVSTFPIQDDPYAPTKETGLIINDILGEFVKSPMTSSSKFLLIGTSIGSIAITILIVTIFKVLG
ncbi:hypothetical protein [Viridibacillus arvi]|uniref:hypothetical protein n=1 Tax=Viridibacillus arvi TaxID=263475 RepID=UPI003D2665D5